MSASAENQEAIDLAGLFAPAALVEPYMERYLRRSDLPHHLVEAMLYSLMGPGKRLRPVLVVHAAQAIGAAPQLALAPAAAIEMIHCFSLIHDDLPAMDNDDLRRGRPTLHKAAGEAMAILAGDALMGVAFEILTRELPTHLVGPLVGELALGTNGMIAGQVYDTIPDFDPKLDALTRLKMIHTHKTGALIRAAVRMGGLVAGASPDQMRLLTGYGEAIGLMFQIIDDVLDVTQTSEQLGKTAGKDITQNKLTYPAVLGLDDSRAEVDRLVQQACRCLQPLGPAARPLVDLATFLAVRTK
jgi:geranylgeranyl diphosphate synthase type II